MPKTINLNENSAVVIAQSDDWQGIYINGNLVRENDLVSAEEIFIALGVPYDIVDYDGDRTLPFKLNQL